MNNVIHIANVPKNVIDWDSYAGIKQGFPEPKCEEAEIPDPTEDDVWRHSETPNPKHHNTSPYKTINNRKKKRSSELAKRKQRKMKNK